VRYKASKVLILVHVSRPTSLTVNPTEIGTIDNPIDEGTTISITATLTDNQGNPIQGKTLHFYGTDGTEITTATTDTNGQATFNYTANVNDDGKNLKIAYLGD